MMSFRGVPLAIAAAGVAAVAAGCVGFDDGVELATHESANFGRGGCVGAVCGDSNSPEIDHRGVHDLDMTRQERNTEGFRIIGFIKNGTDYRVSVSRATLTGLDMKTGAVVLEGGDPTKPNSLIGARIHVFNDRTLTEYAIQIDGVDSAPYWARPNNQQERTPTYLVNWAVIRAGRPSTEWKNICSAPPGDNNDTMGMNRFHVVFPEHDRISTRDKRVYAKHKNWMNIGCASHAVAKLHLVGLTEAASNAFPALFSSTLAERTTFVKALAADYCGNGLAHTVAGEPLNWKDFKGWMNYASPNAILESRWTEFGASCLNTPRIQANQTQRGLAEFPDVMAAIKVSCAPRLPPPQCTGSPSDFMGSSLMTGTP